MSTASDEGVPRAENVSTASDEALASTENMPRGNEAPADERNKAIVPADLRTSLWARFVEWWRKPLPKWWVLGVGIVGLLALMYNFRPRLEVHGPTTLDEHDPLHFRLFNPKYRTVASL